MRLWGKIEGKLRVISIHNEINKIEKNKNKKNQKTIFILRLKFSEKNFLIRQRGHRATNKGGGLIFAQIPKNGIKYKYDTHISHTYRQKCNK